MVNLTLIVLIGIFYGTYRCCRALFFEPVGRVLGREAAAYDQLCRQVVVAREQIRLLQDEVPGLLHSQCEQVQKELRSLVVIPSDVQVDDARVQMVQIQPLESTFEDEKMIDVVVREIQQ